MTGVPVAIGSCRRNRVLAMGALVALSLQPALRGSRQQPFVERVDVARILIDARVVDDKGRPIRGLAPSDFAVTIDGKPARVESIEWVGSGDSSASQLPLNVAPVGPPPHSSVSGRLIVFLVQKTLLASPAVPHRDVTALIRTLQLTDPLLASLTSQDRVAVLSFDSHLRIWSDFSDDFTLVRDLLRKKVIREHPRQVASSASASLVMRLSQERGRTVSTMEEALQLIGNALEPLPGPKTVILFGYGFGRLDALKRTLADAANLPGFLNDDYKKAFAALVKARVSVFSLDVTDAHHHALEIGLQAIATDTGGFFTRTNIFPDQAINRIADALAGHYVLFVEKPAVQPGSHHITVTLNEGRQSTVYAPRMYADPPKAPPLR
jgi:VWFA-related protein